MSEPLRILVIDEGVLGHRTLRSQLEASLSRQPGVEASFLTVPPPSRPGRLALRRVKALGDADLFGLRWRLRWSWQVRRLLYRHAHEADVALIATQASALLIKGPMKRIPCVLSVDATVGQFTALEYLGPRDSWSSFQQGLIARLERRAFRGAAAVVAWTEWNTAAIRAEYGDAKFRIETIHPGLDAEWWGAAAERAPHSAPPLRVLFVGNDVGRKGLAILVGAARRLDPQVVVDVVTGDEVEESGPIRVHHGLSSGTAELRAMYRDADVFVLPTEADAVPWAVIEAMAAGLPVVASDVGAIGELVRESGLLIQPGGTRELTEALQSLADPELRQRLGERARARVHERYDSAPQTARLVELMRELSATAGPVGRLRMRRRAFIAGSAGAVAAAAVATPYAPLAFGDQFERLVASHLGIEPELARQLLANAKAHYGSAEYDARATAFALAVRDPLAAVLPDHVRRKALNGLIEPMLSPAAANLAYALTGNDPGGAAPCSGLVRQG